MTRSGLKKARAETGTSTIVNSPTNMSRLIFIRISSPAFALSRLKLLLCLLLRPVRFRLVILSAVLGRERSCGFCRASPLFRYRKNQTGLAYLRSAVAGALQHPKICAPRSYGFAVLVGHDPRDLVQMR